MKAYMLWIAIAVYLIQIVIVLKELNEGEYTKKIRVILDLIPFFWVLNLVADILVLIYELSLERALENFKKLK